MAEKTCVIFRKDEFGVFAIFPELPGNINPEYCAYYTLYGGHSSGDYKLMMMTSKPATEEDYRHTYNYLTNKHSYGYDLRVVKRASQKMHQKRYDELTKYTQLLRPSSG